jgi:hypothetical protein
MIKSIRHRFLGCILLAIFLASTSSLWAQVELRGRLMLGSGGSMASPVNIRIKVDSYTTVDEVRQLAQALNSGGDSGLFTAFRKMKKGSMRFVGGAGLNIGLNAAYEKPTDNGFKYVFFSKSQSVEPGSNLQAYSENLFLVIELNVDKNYKGEGKIYEAASIRFTEQGTIEMQSSTTPTKDIVDVKPVK